MIFAGSDSAMMYALNADTGAVIWTHQLGTVQYSCGGNQYTFGIAGVAAIDRSRNRVYVGDGAAQVHALDLTTGAEAPGWPITIASPASTNFIYSGLTYNPSNGILYAETSSTCDISPWYGRIVAINGSSATISGTFYPTQGTSGGGIWGFGGASIDPVTNDVFVATGNADTTNGASQNAFYAEQIVELTPDVSTVLANNYPGLPVGGNDLDFGATPLLFQPRGCPAMLAAINKGGMFFLYNRANVGNGPVQAVQMSITSDNGDFIGVPAYDPVTNYVYVEQPATFGIYKPGVAAFSMQSNCTINPVPVWAAQFGADGALINSDTPRSPISIANGVLYISDYVTAQTYAFDASSGAQLWSHSVPLGGIVGPIVANGRLYVTGDDGTIMAWTPMGAVRRRR